MQFLRRFKVFFCFAKTAHSDSLVASCIISFLLVQIEIKLLEWVNFISYHFFICCSVDVVRKVSVRLRNLRKNKSNPFRLYFTPSNGKLSYLRQVIKGRAWSTLRIEQSQLFPYISFRLNPTSSKYIMPTTIPFDSSLVLGHLIDENKITALQGIAAAQRDVDIAESNLNSLLQAQLTLNATVAQVTSLGVTLTSDLENTMLALNQAVANSAANLIQVKADAYGPEGTVTKAKMDATNIMNVDAESPIDFTSSPIQRLPFSSNSINLDSQYFSYDSNSQDSQSHVASIKGFIAHSVSVLGFERSGQLTAAAGEQVSSQLERRKSLPYFFSLHSSRNVF